jgi:hypothetical protein
MFWWLVLLLLIHPFIVQAILIYVLGPKRFWINPLGYLRYGGIYYINRAAKNDAEIKIGEVNIRREGGMFVIDVTNFSVELFEGTGVYRPWR